MHQRCCNYCGQPLPEIRLNVRLTPLKARIFDLIQRGGDNGILRNDLRDILGLGSNCLKSHVWQINEAIEDSGYRIRALGRSNQWEGNGVLYRLVQVTTGAKQ